MTYVNGPMRCPVCSGPMNARVNRLDEPFFGCKQFPKCMGCRDAEGYTYNAYDADSSGFGASYERVGAAIEVLCAPPKGRVHWYLAGPLSDERSRNLAGPLSDERSRKLNQAREMLRNTVGQGSRARIISAMFRIATAPIGKDVPLPAPLPPDSRINAAISLGRLLVQGTLAGVDFNDRLARFQDSISLSRRPYDETTRQELATILGMDVNDLPTGVAATVPLPPPMPITVGMLVMHKRDGRRGVVVGFSGAGWVVVRREGNGEQMEVPERNLIPWIPAPPPPAVNNQTAPAVPEKEEKSMKIEEQKTTMGKLKDQGSMFAGAVADGLADAAVEEAGDVLLDTAKDLFDDEALLAVLLASPDGRELLKCVTGFVLESVAVHGGIPKADIVSNVVQRQYRSSARRIGGPRIKKIMLRMTKLVEIGERLPALRESNKTITEELAETPATVAR